MKLTPRQMDAWLQLFEKLVSIERAHALTIAAIGAQGDKQAIEKTLKDLSD